MPSHVVHDLVVVPIVWIPRPGPRAPRMPRATSGAPSAEYELRLLDARNKPVKTLRFRRPDDDSARRFILGVREDFERYELWRGMRRIDAGGRLIIR